MEKAGATLWTWLSALRSLSQRARAESARVQNRAAALLRRFFPSESQHLFALTVSVGVVCGLVAVAFHLGIRTAESWLIDQALQAPGESWVLWTVLSPTLGGLVAGALLTFVVPGARGSGIPQVKAAFAFEGGRIRARDAAGKFFISILQIGSGASLGREGPTVHICAGATSLLARLTALPAKDMRRLLPVGVAAGIAAAFNAPIAAVTFTIEEIVGTLDHAVLSGVVVAAALAAVIERGVLGVHPIIEVQQSYGLDHPASLVFYAALGIFGGVVSVMFTDGLLTLRAWFRDFRALPHWSHPAVGGLVTGALAAAVMGLLHTTGVTGGGYEALGKALGGQLELKVLLALGAMKLVATVFSYSSGGAGGIFAPALFIGSMLGGAVGYLDVSLLQHEPQQLGAFALVGMGAVFAGVIRAPITSVLIIFEMTGGYGLVLPLMLANMTSYVIARRLRATPIYEALLEQDGVSLPRAAVRAHPLDQVWVSDAMTTRVVSVLSTDTVGDVRDSLLAAPFQLVPAIDETGAVRGVVSLSDMRTALPPTPMTQLLRKAETTLADVPLARAMVQMNDRGVRQLVVLDSQTASRLVGVLTMTDVIRAHAAAVGVEPPRQSERLHAEGLLVVRGSDLVQEVPTVAAGAPMDELVDALARSAPGVVLVRAVAGNTLGIVMLEQVRDFIRDDRLQRMLVAKDLARAVPTVERTASMAHLVAVSASADSPALITPLEQGGDGVITRAALGTVLLEWYGQSARKPTPSPGLPT